MERTGQISKVGDAMIRTALFEKNSHRPIRRREQPMKHLTSLGTTSAF
jgi:transposase-like protein